MERIRVLRPAVDAANWNDRRAPVAAGLDELRPDLIAFPEAVGRGG